MNKNFYYFVIPAALLCLFSCYRPTKICDAHLLPAQNWSIEELNDNNK